MSCRTLQKIYTFGAAKQGMGIIKKFFKQQDNAAGLAECQAALRHSLEIFRVSLCVVADFTSIYTTTGSNGDVDVRWNGANEENREAAARRTARLAGSPPKTNQFGPIVVCEHPHHVSSKFRIDTDQLTGTVPGMGDRFVHQLFASLASHPRFQYRISLLVAPSPANISRARIRSGTSGKYTRPRRRSDYHPWTGRNWEDQSRRRRLASTWRASQIFLPILRSVPLECDLCRLAIQYRFSCWA